MSNSSPDLQAVLDAGRTDAAPSGERERIKASVLARVGASTLVAASAASVTTSSAAASGLSIGAKLLGVVAALVLAGGVATGVVAYPQGRHAPPRVTESVAPRASVAPVAPVEPPLVERAPVSAVPSAAPPERAPEAVSHPVASVPSSAQAPTLAAEVALLRDANAALGAGQPDRALSLLAQFGKQFPHGSLTEERRAVTAIAECRAHPGAPARSRAQAFLRGAPASPLVDRVRAACEQ